MAISGFCDPKLDRVGQEFARSFEERGEVGASVCVTLEGETVVDLWGGTARVDTSAPWTTDTVALIFSSTKGATALCAHILASRGLLDLDAPVVQYWPEFGKAGKERIPVRMLLNHQAGIPILRKRLPKGAFYDWNFMIAALEEEEPFWEPGTRHGYHSLTMGWLVGEVVKRISGKSLGSFFQDEVARPLGIDFWIGLPEEIEPRTARLIPPGPPPPEVMEIPYFAARLTDRTSLPGLVYWNGGGWGATEWDSRASHAAEIPAGNAITNGRGMAGMYAPLACGGSLKGVQLVDADTIARMAAVSSATSMDAVGLVPRRYSLGFMKSVDNRRQPPGLQGSTIMSEEAFGHAGMGGSLGFADPKARMSFGYVMNKMAGAELTPDDRAQSLVDAAYLSLGYRSKASGSWI